MGIVVVVVLLALTPSSKAPPSHWSAEKGASRKRKKKEGRKRKSRSLPSSLLPHSSPHWRRSERPARKWAGSKTPSPSPLSSSSADRPPRSLVPPAGRAVGSHYDDGRTSLRHSGKSQKLRTASRGANDGQNEGGTGARRG